MSSTGPVDGPRLTPAPQTTANETSATGPLGRLAGGEALGLGDLSLTVGKGDGAPRAGNGTDVPPAPGGTGMPLGGNGASLKAEHAAGRLAAWEEAAPAADARRALTGQVEGMMAGREGAVAGLADTLRDGGPVFAHAALQDLATAARASADDFETAATSALSGAMTMSGGAEAVAALGARASTYALAAPGSDVAALSALARQISGE